MSVAHLQVEKKIVKKEINLFAAGVVSDRTKCCVPSTASRPGTKFDAG